MKSYIEVVSVLIDGKITTDRREIYGKMEFGDFMPKLIRREVFKFMEAAGLWREHKLSEAPTLFKFTREAWQEAEKLGIVHGVNNN